MQSNQLSTSAESYAYIPKFKSGDKVRQFIQSHSPEFDVPDRTLIVQDEDSLFLYFVGFDKGFMVDRFQLYQEEEESNVEIDPEISLGSTKDGNPKDGLGDKKVPLWLCSPIAKAAWSVAQFVGMTKYGAWNWRVTGVRASVYLSAMQRHMDRYMSGEEIDPVDKTPHLGHIMACCAIILDAKAAGKLTDDRPPVVGIQNAYADVEEQMRIALENYGHMKPKHMTVNDTNK